MILIDGSHGGGQLLRTALSLSVITKQPFRIINTRSRREDPGLKPQHLAVLNAMGKICNADIKGNFIGSHEIEFIPKDFVIQKQDIAIGTAGSTTLVLQTMIPVFIRHRKEQELVVNGGTDTKWCPMSLYFKHVYLDFLRRMGIDIELNIEKFGFFPKGGGKVALHFMPKKEFQVPQFVERGKKQRIIVRAYASQELKEKNVAERMIDAFKERLQEQQLEEEIVYTKTASTGCFIQCSVEYENYCIGDGVLGELKKSAEDVGRECADKIKELMASEGVDHFAADQLMIFMALHGKGTIKATTISDHVATNAAVIEKFLPVRFTTKNNNIVCGPVV